MAAYWIPRAATTARSASVSNESSMKSATAMGSTRRASRTLRPPPRPRMALARRIPVSASASEGLERSGGVATLRWATKLARARSFLSNGT